MGTLNPDAYSPMSGRFIGEDGNVQNVVDLLGASTPVSTATLNPDAYSPTSGRFIGEDGETHNIVDMLGGSNAVSAERLNINAYSPMSGRFIGEDGKVYNLVDMIGDNQSSLTEAINMLNGTKGTYTPSEMAPAILDAIPTETANGTMITIDDAAAYPVQECVTTLEPVQEGSGDPSPENVRPITGYTGVELTRTGKNLLNSLTVEQGSLNAGGSEIASTSRIRTPYIYLSAGTYTLSNSDMRQIIYVYDTDANKSFIQAESYTSWQTSIFSLTLTGDRYVRFVFSKINSPDIVPSDLQNAQLELGSTATAYEPYQGEKHSITFPQEQSPVYGGEVDWVNGVLRVTEVGVTYDGSADEVYDAVSNVPNFELLAIIPYTSKEVAYTQVAPKNISNYLKAKSRADLTKSIQGFAQAGRSLRIYMDDFTSTEDFRNYFKDNPLQVVYEIATPIEISLTPEVITLLKGENNVWTDSGTSKIEYKVDLQTYINKLINAQNNVNANNLLSASRGTENIEPLLNTEEVDNVITDNDTEEEEVKVSE